MKIRGNYKLFYLIELITGIILIFSFSVFGDKGLFVLILFFIGLFLTQKLNPDEREIQLNFQINTYESIVIGIAMGIIYFLFPTLNWFYALISISLISRGIIGFLTFQFS